MKDRKIYTLIILAAILLILFIILNSCDLMGGPVSIAKRINMFKDDLNSEDRSEVYTNFHPTATEDREAIKSETYFEGSPLAIDNKPFSFTQGDPTDVGSGLKQVIADFTNDIDTWQNAATFIMQTGGNNDDWYIKTFTLDIGEGLYEIKRIK